MNTLTLTGFIEHTPSPADELLLATCAEYQTVLRRHDADRRLARRHGKRGPVSDAVYHRANELRDRLASMHPTSTAALHAKALAFLGDIPIDGDPLAASLVIDFLSLSGGLP